MITRVYLKNKINLKYEPYSTFKELKDIMEKNEDKIEKLRNNVQEYEEKLKLMVEENKKLNKIINYFHQEKNKNIELKQNTLNLNYKNSIKFRKISKDKLSKEYNSSKHRSSYNYPNQRLRLNSAKLPIKNNFLKKDVVNLKSKNSISPASNINERKKSSSFIVINNKQFPENIDSKLLKNPLYQSIQSMNCNKLINKYYGIVDDKKKEYSKDNNYRRINKQNIVTYLNEFKQLINHTNRLFLYQAKISPKIYLERNRNISLNRPKINKLLKMKRLNKSAGNSLQDFVNSKIISKINGIINNLQYKDKDGNKNAMNIN